MIADALLSFGQVDFASSNLGAAGFVEFPTCLDVDEFRDIGKGGQYVFQIHVDTDVNLTLIGGGDPDYMVVDFQLAFDPATTAFNAQTVDVVAKSGSYAAANNESPVDASNYNAGRMTAGTDFYVCLPPQSQGSNSNRYLKCIVAAGLTGGGVSITSGKVTVKLAPSPDLITRHPTGYSV